MKNLTVFFWGAVEDACSCLSDEYWRSVSAGWKGKSFIRIGLDTHAISGARAFYSTGCGVNEKNTTMGRKKWTCMNKNNNIHNNNHNNNTRRRRRRGEKTHKKETLDLFIPDWRILCVAKHVQVSDPHVFQWTESPGVYAIRFETVRLRHR